MQVLNIEPNVQVSDRACQSLGDGKAQRVGIVVQQLVNIRVDK
jgi:hypothetical protein